MKLPRWSHWVILVVFGVALLAVPACKAANNAPEILSLYADPPSVVPGQNTTLVCEVEDADDDALTFAWTYRGPSIGTILATETDSEVNWTAPEATGEYTVTVSVDDGRGGVVDASCSVTVAVVMTEGSIDVKSSPSGARVYLDGVDTENITPYIATGVLVGEHTVKLTLHGYENREGTVTVEGGETKYVNWALEEAELTVLTLQPGVGQGKDTYVYAANPGSTQGSESYLFAGRGVG
ncbi:MAG: PEGA domain-containing protein, partial [Chloroflexota bacterium]|nr:PEGA domain-containing protein [Chloroflexota bacterium]